MTATPQKELTTTGPAAVTKFDALGLAELVRDRDVSPSELVEAANAHEDETGSSIPGDKFTVTR